MKRYNKTETGKLAERAVQKYLKKSGYKIICSNFRCPIGEIDIIFRKGNDIIFGEVRSITNPNFMQAEESITNSKIKKIVKVAEFYIKTKKLANKNFQFDVFGVYIGEDSKVEINHIKSAFEAD